jgi:hypothetical protein
VSITVCKPDGEGVACKYGEKPPSGISVPDKVLRLVRDDGEDRENFLKDRKCEGEGLGIGAFAYYRRVVRESQSPLFDAIIGVCKTEGASQELIEQLGRAKQETKFTNAMEHIKIRLPQRLLINGHHNPLTALHGALSVGLHKRAMRTVSKRPKM